MDEKEKNDPEVAHELDPLQGDHKPVKSKTFCENFKNMIDNISVEPGMFLFVMAALMTMLTTQNLSLEKACRVNLNYTTEICDSLKAQELGSQNEFEKNAQQLVTQTVAKRTYLTATVPCLLAFFIGSWSDKTGHRKVFLVTGIAGQFCLCFTNMLNVYFFHDFNLQFLIYSEAFIEGITGGWCIFFLTCFSYVSAITAPESRTYRMGLLNFTLTVGFPIGMSITGVLLKRGGYYACYGLAATMHSLNIMYLLFILKDPGRTPDQKKHDGQGFLYFLKTFFDPAHIKDTFAVMLKKTKDNRRTKLLIMLMTVCFLFGPMYGEVSVMYLSTRYRFNWDEVQFSVFQTYNFILHTIGTIFSIMVFSKYLQWHDSVMGLISSTVKICSAFVFGFAPNATIFYIAPVVDLLGGTGILALRSIFTKTVEPHELGKINSMVGLTENLMPLLYVPLYTQVYSATMEVLPGAVFLMSAAMTIPAVAVFIWLLVSHRRGLKQRDKQSKTEMDSL